jgi:hypothetical protein
VTENNDAGRLTVCNWNEGGVKHPSSNDWRASLVPAAAVIPAPIAYIKVVAVKKLVVELLIVSVMASVVAGIIIRLQTIFGLN